MTGSSTKPVPPTIITDPSALNDRTENTPALTLYSANDANLDSVPPSPVFETESKQADNKSSIQVNMEQLLQPHDNPENPFAFTSEQLSALYDPKNVELLSAYGGLEGIAKGLHSNAKDGLSTDEHAPFDPISLNDIIDTHVMEVTKPELDSQGPATPPPAHHTTANSRFAQRAAVFGSNTLPDVKAKNIFQLMWMAFKDKTLVCFNLVLISYCKIYFACPEEFLTASKSY
jgi:Ca2+-transporting ATPase